MKHIPNFRSIELNSIQILSSKNSNCHKVLKDLYKFRGRIDKFNYCKLYRQLLIAEIKIKFCMSIFSIYHFYENKYKFFKTFQ